MSGPYKPGDVVAFAVTAAENISGIAVNKFTRWTSAGSESDGTASIALSVTGTGTQECHCKYTIPSDYAAGDTIALTIILTLASSGAQAPQLAHDSIVLVQWGATALPAGTARTSTGLPALADLQGNSMLGPAQTITDGDGTATLIQISTPFVGAAVGRAIRCIDTQEARQITAFSQNIGSGLWQYTVSPAFTTFSNPAGHTFAIVNLPMPIVDAGGNARAVDSTGNALAGDPLANAVPGSYAAGTAGKVLSDIRKVVQAQGG